MGERKSAGSIEISKTDDGIELFIKNPKLEAFFKQASNGDTTKAKINKDDPDTEFYKLASSNRGKFVIPFVQKGKTLTCQIDVADPGLLFDQNGNIFVWWMRSVGIAEGKKITLKGAYKVEDCQKLEQALTEFTSLLFKEYMTPYMAKILFTVQSFSTEEFVNANKQEVTV